MIEETIAQHRDTVSGGQEIHALAGAPEENARVALEVAGCARDRLDVVVAAGSDNSECNFLLSELLLATPETAEVRVICNPEMTDSGLAGVAGHDGRPILVRVLSQLPPLLIVTADQTVTLTSIESPAGDAYSVIRAPAIVRLLCELFDGIWQGAAAAGPGAVLDGRMRTELTRKILALLRAGVTDEVAARKLAISVRTYRRHVAEIMTMIGSSSRFQAGVKAAELGLLDSRSP
ncbi:LuxR family transcriptional regulator [Streptomyces sp. UNOC14_S4]|uniref:LuxR family transcriptional regulator n=1 Tax=Streptomyces sp. UNOC14_S4 TaxID=2872340 RepID=UPI001E2DB0E3|nr:LuxR family transcriptional regulator [Streptomyces sp. UNOC14_S4]MCC3769978.1 LuxR family transcriptional regulator [Streptomyces sp. UNOC14_S4]